jgi:hypothetical protein
MTRYNRHRNEMLRKRSLLGVAARERNRRARTAAMRDVGGLSTDGCLGFHSVRLLAWPGEDRHLAIVVDGEHRQARTLRGIVRGMAEMIARRVLCR